MGWANFFFPTPPPSFPPLATHRPPPFSPGPLTYRASRYETKAHCTSCTPVVWAAGASLAHLVAPTWVFLGRPLFWIAGMGRHSSVRRLLIRGGGVRVWRTAVVCRIGRGCAQVSRSDVLDSLRTPLGAGQAHKTQPRLSRTVRMHCTVVWCGWLGVCGGSTPARRACQHGATDTILGLTIAVGCCPWRNVSCFCDPLRILSFGTGKHVVARNSPPPTETQRRTMAEHKSTQFRA